MSAFEEWYRNYIDAEGEGVFGKASLQAAWSACQAQMEERERVLVEALSVLQKMGEKGMKPDYTKWMTFHDKVARIAKEALTNAKLTKGGE